MLDIHHVVPHVHEEASGPSLTVTSLCRSLSGAGARVTLHVLEPGLAVPCDVALFSYPASLFGTKVGFSREMAAALREVARRADILHNHSLWMMPNVYPAWAIRGTRCRLVTSPRGTLSPWALGQSRWKKRLMWTACQGRAVRASHCLHATSESELQDIRRLGLRAPVALIPNGVDLPDDLPKATRGDGRRRLLFLSRIHPKKGVDLLLEAWRRVEAKCPDWELQVAGPDNGGYLPRMQKLAADLELERVEFSGPAYGAEKARLYRSASLFVLPTRSENFGVAVAEALAHGVPVITTKEAPWQGLETNHCGWWIDCNVDSLADTLLAATRMSEIELKAYGLRGRAWVQQDYSWRRIGAMMLETYLWLLGGGIAPAWVDRIQ